MSWQASHRQLSSLALAAKAPGSSPSALPGFLSRALPGSWPGSLLAAGLALVTLVLLALAGPARAQVDQNYLEQWLKSSSNNALSATQRTQAEFTTPAHVWNVSRSDNGSVQVVRSPEQWYTLVRLNGELKFVLLINATDAKTTAVQIADAALARSLASLGTGQYPVYEAQDTAWYQLEDGQLRPLGAKASKLQRGSVSVSAYISIRDVRHSGSPTASADDTGSTWSSWALWTMVVLACLGLIGLAVLDKHTSKYRDLETQGGSGKRKLRKAVIETPAKGRARPQVSVHSATAVPASQTAAAIEKTKTEKE
jgi:hypothetical protein